MCLEWLQKLELLPLNFVWVRDCVLWPNGDND
jgi:hypothetical protein